MQKKNLKGLNLSELQSFVISLGEKKYRAAQLFTWLYAKGVNTFDDMTDISKGFRDNLKQHASIIALQPITQRVAADGTIKFLFQLEDQLAIESVLIPPQPDSPNADKRLTLCVSTQVGCPLDCKFCATGAMGFTRNLTAGEIIDQALHAQRISEKRITNLVFMGMGEPMLNYENVMQAIDIINDEKGLNIGIRHITISTAGYADHIRRMADENRKVKLALSLHSLDNDKRTLLMPITKKYPVDELLKALDYYYGLTRSRPTLEYVLFDGFNDTPADLQAIIKLSKRIPCKLNLIPFHPVQFMNPTGFAATLKPTPIARVKAFADALWKANVTAIVRGSSGEDINAACGQLAVTTAKKKIQEKQ
jgi:23S rRNA (adenine2503-C2)-methyltransferase